MEKHFPVFRLFQNRLTAVRYGYLFSGKTKRLFGSLPGILQEFISPPRQTRDLVFFMVRRLVDRPSDEANP